MAETQSAQLSGFDSMVVKTLAPLASNEIATPSCVHSKIGFLYGWLNNGILMDSLYGLKDIKMVAALEQLNVLLEALRFTVVTISLDFTP